MPKYGFWASHSVLKSYHTCRHLSYLCLTLSNPLWSNHDMGGTIYTARRQIIRILEPLNTVRTRDSIPASLQSLGLTRPDPEGLTVVRSQAPARCRQRRAGILR